MENMPSVLLAACIELHSDGHRADNRKHLSCIDGRSYAAGVA
jgi:hypothetical protein